MIKEVTFIHYLDIYKLDPLLQRPVQHSFSAFVDLETRLNLATKKRIFVSCTITVQNPDQDLAFLVNRLNSNAVFACKVDEFDLDAVRIDQCTWHNKPLFKGVLSLTCVIKHLTPSLPPIIDLPAQQV